MASAAWQRQRGAPAELAAPGFRQRAQALTRLIPCGQVSTYGDLARMLGEPWRAREVGWALNALKGDSAPAHRVVNREGVLSGGWAFGDPEVQRQLLLAEGVQFDERGRVRLNLHRWPGPAAEETVAPSDDGPGGLEEQHAIGTTDQHQWDGTS